MLLRKMIFPSLLYLKKAAAVAVAFQVLSAVSVAACPRKLPTTLIDIKDARLLVEVAATPAARRCGLSLRSGLEKNQGMLFVFPATQPLTFWMKDTWIPLSIAFLDKHGRILSIQKMTPMQTAEKYRSPRPTRYALEVNQGWFEIHGVHEGDIVEFSLPIGLNIK
jgi:uncharacterized membrane protein (UPF0127 family)